MSEFFAALTYPVLGFSCFVRRPAPSTFAFAADAIHLSPFVALMGCLMHVLSLGFAYLDCPLDARQVPVPARFGWLIRHAGATLGYGSVLFLVLLVPLLGTMLLPLTVAGAALLAHRLDSPGNTM